MPYHVCTLKDKEEVKCFKNFLFGLLQKCIEVSYDMQIHLAVFFHIYLKMENKFYSPA